MVLGHLTAPTWTAVHGSHSTWKSTPDVQVWPATKGRVINAARHRHGDFKNIFRPKCGTKLSGKQQLRTHRQCGHQTRVGPESWGWPWASVYVFRKPTEGTTVHTLTPGPDAETPAQCETRSRLKTSGVQCFDGSACRTQRNFIFSGFV